MKSAFLFFTICAAIIVLTLGPSMAKSGSFSACAAEETGGEAGEELAEPAAPEGVKGLPAGEEGVEEKLELQKGGCHAACPHCLRTCTLNVGHYSNHRCPEGHEWL